MPKSEELRPQIYRLLQHIKFKEEEIDNLLRDAHCGHSFNKQDKNTINQDLMEFYTER